MTGLNHAATGALVAVAIHNPAIGLPAAFLSHFLTDMLPHWDYYRLTSKQSKRWTNGAVDFCLSLVLLVILVLTLNAPAWLIFAGGLLGILPDAMWIPYLIWRRPSIQGNTKSILNRIRRFHIHIQWFETTKIVGLYSEIIWFVLMIIFIYKVHY